VKGVRPTRGCSNAACSEVCGWLDHYRRPVRCGFNSHETPRAPDRDPGSNPGRTPLMFRYPCRFSELNAPAA